MDVWGAGEKDGRAFHWEDCNMMINIYIWQGVYDSFIMTGQIIGVSLHDWWCVDLKTTERVRLEIGWRQAGEGKTNPKRKQGRQKLEIVSRKGSEAGTHLATAAGMIWQRTSVCVWVYVLSRVHECGSMKGWIAGVQVEKPNVRWSLKGEQVLQKCWCTHVQG